MSVFVINLFTIIATIPALLWIAFQVLLGKSSIQTGKNRIGIATASSSGHPVIWLHAASLGELTSIKPFLLYLAQTRPDHRLLITTNNPAALTAAEAWTDLPTLLQSAPIDLPFVLRRFLNHWQPVAFINIESEIWPNRFKALKQNNIPSIMLNARVSDKSTKRLGSFGVKALGLDLFSHIYAQNSASAENFKAIGILEKRVETIPNFKSLVTLAPPDPKMLERYDRANTFLAASTHEGEETLILNAFATLWHQNPNLRLILVPRHPNRVKAVEAMCQNIGLNVSIYGDEQKPEAVSLVDSLGSLQRIYPLAAVTFVGGSLVPDIGGHTPYEPIRAGSAIVSGPFHHNFTEEYAALSASGGCLITPVAALAKSLSDAAENTDNLSQAAQNTYPAAANPMDLFAAVAQKVGL